MCFPSHHPDLWVIYIKENSPLVEHILISDTWIFMGCSVPSQHIYTHCGYPMRLHRHHPLLATAIPLPVLPPRQRAETFRGSPSVAYADHRLSSLPYVVRPFRRVTAAQCCYPPTFLHAYCSVLPICQRPWFLVSIQRDLEVVARTGVEPISSV